MDTTDAIMSAFVIILIVMHIYNIRKISDLTKRNNCLINSNKSWRNSCKLLLRVLQRNRAGIQLKDSITRDEWAEIVASITVSKSLNDD